MAVTIELDIFSGRPNPTWTLSEAESAELVAALQSLPGAAPATEEEGLGYRGFIVSNLPAGLPASVRVYRQLIRMPVRSPQVYQDAHGVERQLLQQAAQRGYGGLVDSLLNP